MHLEDWQKDELNKLRFTVPVEDSMHAVRFVSNSAGQQRRRKPRVVTLIRYGGHCRSSMFPWDEWATEILGEHAEGEDLQEQFELALIRNNGKF